MLRSPVVNRARYAAGVASITCGRTSVLIFLISCRGEIWLAIVGSDAQDMQYTVAGIRTTSQHIMYAEFVIRLATWRLACMRARFAMRFNAGG